MGEEKAAIHWRAIGLDQLSEQVNRVSLLQCSTKGVEIEVATTIKVDEDASRPDKLKEDGSQFLLFGIDQLMSVEALNDFCAAHHIDYEHLAGSNKQEKIKSLINRLTAQDRLIELLVALGDILTSMGIPVPDELQRAIDSGGHFSQPQQLPGAHFECSYNYRVFASGDLLISVHVNPVSAETPFLPRLGLQMTLPSGFEQFTWYGRGPHETYCDRKEGAQVGVYTGTVDGQYVPYIVPEENGNKTDVRWVALTNSNGIGLLATSDRLFEVSAHHYTIGNLTKARHTYELDRREEIYLNLDYAQSGLGSASCGPGRLEKYQLKPQEFQFTIRLKPFSAQRESPMTISKQSPV